MNTWAVYVKGNSTDNQWERWATFEERTEAVRYRRCLFDDNEAAKYTTGAYDPELEVYIMEA